MPQFVKDVEDIRQRAIAKIEEGPVTNAYRGDKERTIAILNEALATEIVCVLRYLHHYFMATGVHGKAIADEFKEHADAEREHADLIAERIQQLGGKPDMNPGNLVARSATQYREGESLADMIREDLIAERVVIEVYNEMVRHFANNDPTTRVLIEGILKDEEEHASDLVDLLYVVDPHSGETEGQDPGSDPLTMEHGNGGRSRQRVGGRREPLLGEGENCEMELRTELPRGQQQQQRNQRGQQPGGRNRAQGRGPTFRQEQAGRAFAGEDRPNPPGRAGSGTVQGQQQPFGGREGGRGRRGRRGRRAA